jgi:glycine/D-amino acid oxidase-like deaminating enzyme
MSPPVDSVDSSPDMPKKVDVVIIGGGIVGVSTALALTRKGHSVALCEKGEDRR